jgi:hypothetical protein
LFAAQIATLFNLTQFGYKPELCFVGSGGGVATFIAKAACWNPNKILSVSRLLSSDCFISEWTAKNLKILPSHMTSVINGSAYQASQKGVCILKKFLSEKTVQDGEVWIAAINEKTGKVLLSCNKEKKHSLIQGKRLNTQLVEYETLSYLSGDLEEISKVILASACIPVLLEPVCIKNNNYVDCGVKYGSSLTPMFKEVLNMARNGPVHMVYVTGCDISKMSNLLETEMIGLFDHIKLASHHATRSHVEYDRNVAYSIVLDDCEDEPWYREFPGEDLEYVMEAKKKTRRCLIEIYPSWELPLNLCNFCGEELERVILKYTKMLKIRAWWSGQENDL